MPATEPDEPELPLWPEPGTGHGGPAAPSPASRAGEGAASPTPPADVLPAVHDRPGPPAGPARGRAVAVGRPGAPAAVRPWRASRLGRPSRARPAVARPPARRCRPPGGRDAVAAADDPVPGRGLAQARVRDRARAGGRDVSGFRLSDGGRTCRPARAGREPAPTGQALRSAAASRGADHQKWPRTVVSLKPALATAAPSPALRSRPRRSSTRCW